MEWIQEHNLLIAWSFFFVLLFIAFYSIFRYMTEHSVLSKIQKENNEKKTAAERQEKRKTRKQQGRQQEQAARSSRQQ